MSSSPRPPSEDRESVYRTLRNWFLAGLLVLIPPGFTLYILNGVWGWIDHSVSALLPAWITGHVGFRFLASFVLGIGLPLLLIVVSGWAAHTYFGVRFREFYEDLFIRVPVLGRIFTWIRQIAKMIFEGDRQVFTKVALVEYPRKGLWTLAFLSSPAAQEIQTKAASELVSIFVPTTPNPTSGFLLMIPAGEVILLDMGPEDALKVILSGGLISPGTPGTSA